MGIKLTDSDTIPIMLESGFKPLESYPGANTPWKCLHIECGQIVYPIFSNVKNGKGCKICSGNQKFTEEKVKEIFPFAMDKMVLKYRFS